MRLSFPSGFFWGSATSAHQVEGGNHNDWSEWEIKNANRLAENTKNNASSYTRHRELPDYIKNSYPSPLSPENYISGKACDHYNRFREDFDIAKSLGQNAHRFSIEWSRIEPEEGKWNEKEIEHYREVIHAIRERGMEPFMTLWHWTNPIWFIKKGGWEMPDAPKLFARFSKKMAESFPDVKYWITLNEPETFARHGYFLKFRPPGKNNPFLAYKALRNLKEGHQMAYQSIKSISADSQIGLSESLVYFEPYNCAPQNIILMKLVKWWRNNPFFAELATEVDFIGLQYYFHSRIRLHPKSNWWIQFNENKKVTDMGWEIYPEGIYHVLKEFKKYNKPIFITENGITDIRDIYRADFIKDHIKYVHKAISEGVDVRGYFYWSLLDNFEWNEGFWPRFGLVEVDYKTMERRIRQSALEYKKICESNSLEDSLEV